VVVRAIKRAFLVADTVTAATVMAGTVAADSGYLKQARSGVTCSLTR
jgi:hypothetical protein